MVGALLTREGLEALLAYLDTDRDRAGEKYEEIRHRLMKLFECRGIVPSEEPADETIDRVARNVLRERWALQRERREGPTPGQLPAGPGPEVAAEIEDAEHRSACLEKC